MTDRAGLAVPVEVVLFDLDGTLTDPGVGIARSAAYALESLGLPPLDEASLRRFVGPPLQEGLVNVAGVPAASLDAAVLAYRAYFAERGIFENAVYDGVIEVLDTLTSHGVVLGLATSKPRVFAVQILDHFEISSYFSVIAGAELDGSRRHKHDVIAYARELLAKAGSTVSVERTLMVGDREHDVRGALEHGIATIAVTWGYGSSDELRQAGAAELVDTPAHLLTTLKRLAGIS